MIIPMFILLTVGFSKKLNLLYDTFCLIVFFITASQERMGMILLLTKFITQSSTFLPSPHQAVCTWFNMSVSHGRYAGTRFSTSYIDPLMPSSDWLLRISWKTGLAALIWGNRTKKSHRARSRLNGGCSIHWLFCLAKYWATMLAQVPMRRMQLRAFLSDVFGQGLHVGKPCHGSQRRKSTYLLLLSKQIWPSLVLEMKVFQTVLVCLLSGL